MKFALKCQTWGQSSSISFFKRPCKTWAPSYFPRVSKYLQQMSALEGKRDYCCKNRNSLLQTSWLFLSIYLSRRPSRHETRDPHYCPEDCQWCLSLKKKQLSQETMKQQQEQRIQWLEQKQLEYDDLFRRCQKRATEFLWKHKETESVPSSQEHLSQLSQIFQEEILKTKAWNDAQQGLQNKSSQPTVTDLLAFKDSCNIKKMNVGWWLLSKVGGGGQDSFRICRIQYSNWYLKQIVTILHN